MKTWSTMEDYFRALERCLDCPGEDRERFLAQARRMADDFLQGKPDAAPDEVAGCLGEPEELAQCFLEELDRALDVTAGSLDATAGEDELAPLALSLALRSYADKLACQRLLELIRARRPQPEKGKKAKSSREHPAD